MDFGSSTERTWPLTSEDNKAKRAAPRIPLQIDLSAYLFAMPERSAIRCLGVDVSKNGLGIVGFQELPPQMPLLLAVNRRDIELIVVWSKADKVRANVFHAGIKIKDQGQDIEREFQAAGLLHRVEAYSFRTLKARGDNG